MPGSVSHTKLLGSLCFVLQIEQQLVLLFQGAGLTLSALLRPRIWAGNASSPAQPSTAPCVGAAGRVHVHGVLCQGAPERRGAP